LSALVLLNILRADESDCANEYFTIQAFGGIFHVPTYLHLIVDVAEEKSIQLRFVPRSVNNGQIRGIFLRRNGSFPEHTPDRWKIIDAYELNDFKVTAYESLNLDVGKELVSAIIERDDDVAHVVVESIAALNELLSLADALGLGASGR